MKKVIVTILALMLMLAMVGCGNDTAEENEVMSYLTKYNWYYEIGWKYDMIEMYQFNSDNTYKSVIDSTLSQSFHEGTFEINTSKDTIRFKPSDGSGYTWTYSLYSDGMKLFSDSKEFQKI